MKIGPRLPKLSWKWKWSMRNQ